jgi:hypothetical protein
MEFDRVNMRRPTSRAVRALALISFAAAMFACNAACTQGLTLARFKAQLEDHRDTSLTLELNLCTFGTHPRVNLRQMGDKASLS